MKRRQNMREEACVAGARIVEVTSRAAKIVQSKGNPTKSFARSERRLVVLAAAKQRGIATDRRAMPLDERFVRG